LKVRNGTSATFFSPQFRNQFGSPQYCGIAEVRTKIADAHLWKTGGSTNQQHRLTAQVGSTNWQLFFVDCPYLNLLSYKHMEKIFALMLF
jgi:hypothetical protein